MCSAPKHSPLHSRYDPVKEASRFLDAQGIAFIPAIAVVTEPGESYLARELLGRYPGIRLVAIRYQNDLYRDSDPLWHAIWRPACGIGIVPFLMAQIPDETLPVTAFIGWKPSDAVWPEAAGEVWKGISSLIRLQQSVMSTRAFFGKRWFSNMVWNGACVSNVIVRPKTEQPVLLAAAGPSLDSLYPFDRDRFFLFAVSAALESLLHRGYKPDLCIATDGGFWAREHLGQIPGSIPLAFPLEAAIPSGALERNPALILDYGSMLERKIAGICGFGTARAERNGTVAGTAAAFALEMTTRDVYAAGLDLAPSRSSAHTRPYAADARAAGTTDRLDTDAGKLYEGNLSTAALDVYADWFSSRGEHFRSRFFRIGNSGRPIAGIRSIDKGCAGQGLKPTDRRHHAEAEPIPHSSRRTGELRVWIEDCADRIDPFIDAKHENALQDFAAQISGDPELAEIVETVSYAKYVKYLRESRSTTVSANAVATVSDLCRDASDTLRKISGRLSRHG